MGLAFAASLGSDSSNFLSMQQQLKIMSAGALSQQLQIMSAGAASNKPHRLGSTPKVDQKVALLSIVHDLEGKNFEKDTQLHQSAHVTMRPQAEVVRHDQQPSASSGKEHPLESWSQLQQQEAYQQQLKEEPAALKVWRCVLDVAVARKVTLGIFLSFAASIGFLSMFWQPKAKPRGDLRVQQEVGDAGDMLALASSKAQGESKLLMPSEVSKQLADLADAIGRVKMPSEAAFHIAMQPAEPNESDNAKVAKESVGSESTQS